MLSTHAILRKRLLDRAGIFEVSAVCAPSLPEIYKMQWSADFEQKMRDRMAMGFFRYGSLREQIGKQKFKNIESIKSRLAQYEVDHNREHLVDIANLALVEFVVHPEFPFVASDDTEHAKPL